MTGSRSEQEGEITSSSKAQQEQNQCLPATHFFVLYFHSLFSVLDSVEYSKSYKIKKVFGKWTKWVYPPLFKTKVGGGKMQTSSPPVITPNRSQSNPDDMITLPRPIQSVGMDLHDVSDTSTGQTLPRERRAPPGTHFCPTIWWVYPHSATIFILHPLLSTFSSTFVRNIKQQLQGSCARVRRIQNAGRRNHCCCFFCCFLHINRSGLNHTQ